MNIIQIQDRLKGLPEDALVNYVKEPMGEVPIYLALGELQRRKDMKERFQASQADKPSVAEQLVAESEPMQMGLGAMAPQQMMPGGQGVGAPPPASEMDPRQLAASGIAANPQSAVGGTAMMAKGGIVGEVTNKFGKSNPVYEDGSIGALAGLAVPPVTSAVLGLGSLLGRGVMGAGRYLGNKMSPLFRPAGTKIAPSGQSTSSTLLPTVTTPNALVPTVATAPGYLRQPANLAELGVLGGLTYGASQLFGGDPEPEDNKDDKGDGKKGPKKETAKDKKRTLEDRVKEYMDAMGTNEGLERVKGRLAEFDERAKGKRGDAANMALIEAGLNIAAGQSPDALSNIATGATAGVKGYTERLKDADAAEKEVLALDLAIGQAERTERAAAVNFGIKSIEAERAAQQKYNLMVQKLAIQNSMLPPKERAKIITQIEGTNFLQNFDDNYAENNGERSIGSQKYLNDRAQALEVEIGRRSGLGAPIATNTTPEGMKQAGVTPDGRIVYEDADGKQYVGG